MGELTPKQIAPSSGNSIPSTRGSREADACKITPGLYEAFSLEDFLNTLTSFSSALLLLLRAGVFEKYGISGLRGMTLVLSFCPRPRSHPRQVPLGENSFHCFSPGSPMRIHRLLEDSLLL